MRATQRCGTFIPTHMGAWASTRQVAWGALPVPAGLVPMEGQDFHHHSVQTGPLSPDISGNHTGNLDFHSHLPTSVESEKAKRNVNTFTTTYNNKATSYNVSGGRLGGSNTACRLPSHEGVKRGLQPYSTIKGALAPERQQRLSGKSGPPPSPGSKEAVSSFPSSTFSEETCWNWRLKRDSESHNTQNAQISEKSLSLPGTKEIWPWMKRTINVCHHHEDTRVGIIWKGF